MTITAIPQASATLSVGSTPTVAGAAPVAPGATITAAIPAPPASSETPQAEAISIATAVAAARQSGLAVLMADLSQALASPAVPTSVRTSIAQVLSLQTAIDPPPTAADLQQAVATSGLFLEAQISEGAMPPPANDLKAALLVVQQVLQAWTDSAPATASGQTSEAASAPQPSSTTSATAPADPTTSMTSPPSMPVANLSAPAGSGFASAASFVPLQTADPETSGSQRIASAARGPETAPETMTLQPATQGLSANPSGPTQAALNPPSLVAATPGPTAAEALAGPLPPSASEPPTMPQPATPVPATFDIGAATSDDAPILSYGLIDTALADAGLEAGTPRTAAATMASSPEASAPPPPFRGGPTTGQPPASPSLNAGAEPAALAHRLLTETTGALARTELHQLASMPDATSAPPTSETGPRWMFELPLATPQGSAVAQFEISRDGGRSGTAESQPTWRARFSIDLEPMGPVHVQVAVTGTRAGVTLWAERPAAADRLRLQQTSLTQGLEGAAFNPAVSVFVGAPPRAPTRAGRFLDQAS